MHTTNPSHQPAVSPATGEDCAVPSQPLAAPLQPYNEPGLSRIRYRIGTFSSFRRAMMNMVPKATLLEDVTPDERPGVSITNPFIGWHEGIDGDYLTTFMDLWAYLADVLTFYQERIANAAYLPTAPDRTYLRHLARLIAYTPDPGAAAQAILAVTVTADGAVDPEAILSVSTQPTPGQPSVPFETTPGAAVRVAYNSLRPVAVARARAYVDPAKYGALGSPNATAAVGAIFDARYAATLPIDPSLLADQTLDSAPVGRATHAVVLDGTATRLALGDYVLIDLMPSGGANATPQRLQRLTAVAIDTTERTTTIAWQDDSAIAYPADAVIYALRIKTTPFGHSAPDWFALQRANSLMSATAPAVFSYANQPWDDPTNAWSYLPAPVDGVSSADMSIDLSALHDAARIGSPGARWAVLQTDAPHWRMQLSSLAGEVPGMPAGGAPAEPPELWCGHFSQTARTELLARTVDNGTRWWLGTVQGTDLQWMPIGPVGGLTEAGGACPALVWTATLPGLSLDGGDPARTQLLGYDQSHWWAGDLMADPDGTPTLVLRWRMLDTAILDMDAASGDRLWVGAFATKGAGRDAAGGASQVLYRHGKDRTWWLGAFAPDQSGAMHLTWSLLTATPSANNLVAGRSWVGVFAPSRQAQLVSYGSGTWWLGTVAGTQLTCAAVAQTPSLGDIAEAPTWAGAVVSPSGTGLVIATPSDPVAQRWWVGSLANSTLTWAPLDTTDQGPVEGITSSYWWVGTFTATGQLLGYRRSAPAGTTPWCLLSVSAEATLPSIEPITDSALVMCDAYGANTLVTRLVLGAQAPRTLPARRFPLRRTVILTGCEALPVRPRLPLPVKMGGTVLALVGDYPDLKKDQTVIVTQQAGGQGAAPPPTEVATVAHTPVYEASDDVTFVPLQRPLSNVYDRTRAVVKANTIEATQGESVPNEILGSGDGSAFQHFTLARFPLTYLPARDPAQPLLQRSTLIVSVNGVIWSEQTSLRGSLPDAPHFITTQDDVGRTSVMFGDGTNGACPPTGVDNIRASYRFGVGSADSVVPGVAQVDAERPGVRSAGSVLVTAGSDMESASSIRAKAPASLKIAGRAVTVSDYEAIARSVPGVEVVSVARLPRDPTALQVTVGGPDGPPSEVIGQVWATLNAVRDRTAPLRVSGYTAVPLDLAVEIEVVPHATLMEVLKSVQKDLGPNGFFSFANPKYILGGPIYLNDIYRILGGVPSIAGVSVTTLRRSHATRPVRRCADVYLEQDELATVDAGAIETLRTDNRTGAARGRLSFGSPPDGEER